MLVEACFLPGRPPGGHQVMGMSAGAALKCTGRRLSSSAFLRDACVAQGGVWVLGMIKGAAADAAGVRQGDELLAIPGATTATRSPFQAAGLLPGAGDSEPAPSVDLQARVL